jgi:hypothetical protein
VASEWGLTPRQSIEIECQHRSEKYVAEECVAILSGRGINEATLVVLAGPASATVIDGNAGGLSGYWPRVWAMRGLLYVWDPSATRVVVDGAVDPSWRVREMSAKVVARRHLDDAHHAMTTLMDDDVARVRAAAQRALIRLVELES